MKYEKLDPSLTMALEDKDELVVFIDVVEPLSQQEANSLGQLGVTSALPGASLITATLSKEGVDHISELSNVRSIRLSRDLTLQANTRVAPIDA